jgi:hypothetical protein
MTRVLVFTVLIFCRDLRAVSVPNRFFSVAAATGTASRCIRNDNVA